MEVASRMLISSTIEGSNVKRLVVDCPIVSGTFVCGSKCYFLT